MKKYSQTNPAPSVVCVHCRSRVGARVPIHVYKKANRTAHFRCAPRADQRPQMETLILQSKESHAQL